MTYIDKNVKRPWIEKMTKNKPAEDSDTKLPSHGAEFKAWNSKLYSTFLEMKFKKFF